MQGEGVNIFSPKQKQYPLVNGMDAARASSSKENAKTWSTEAVVKAIGGIGTIVEYDEFEDVPEIFIAPATFVNRSA
ncbi:xylem serine proteinase 1-like, partial [Trifolium medium]|nr:xylem serine proteinase 1-like [Trifolium medium]